MDKQTDSILEENMIVSPNNLIDQFNSIFHDVAEAIIQDGKLLVTIGNRTMVVRLPIVSGAESKV